MPTHRVDLARLVDEHAALRRVATLVARAASPAEVVEVVVAEVGRLVPADAAALSRYESDGTATLVGSWSRVSGYTAVSVRHPLGSGTLARLIRDTRLPARVESYSTASGSLADAVREQGWRSAVGAPIIVDGDLWGLVAAASMTDEPLPHDTERRLAEFSELVATAIANAGRREEVTRLAEEQAALRRVATLVARGASPADVLTAVAREVAEVLRLPMVRVLRCDDDGTTVLVTAASIDGPDVFPPGTRFPLDGRSMTSRVLQTGRPARVEDYAGSRGAIAAAALRSGAKATAGAPIIVDGRIWGVMAAASQDALPDGAEDRLAEFTELVATAIANAEGRESLRRLADDQAALRRVATLVAEGAPPGEVFAAVSAETARLLSAEGAALTRYDDDGAVTPVGAWTASGGYLHVGTRYAREGTVSGLVFERGAPARIESFADVPGVAAAEAREMGWRSAVGAPITVDGHLWGALAVISTTDRPLAADAEHRLSAFCELVATAIANAESRAELRRLAEEQAALRRLATLVARGAAPADVIEAVVTEAGRTIPADASALARYEPGGTTAAGSWSRTGGYVTLRQRLPLERGTAAWQVRETRRPSRVDSYEGIAGSSAAAAREAGWRSSVGAPILVGGRLWGVMSVASMTDRPLPPRTEERLVHFAELVATAVANAQARAELDASRARIVATADATRRRIERDLHDGAQQRLVSLALELRATEAVLPPELEELRAELSRFGTGLTSVQEELREIARGIHPAILAEGGLEAAVRTLARRAAVPVELDLRAPGRLPEAVEVAAYYVVAEALTNTAKYARASIVHVAVEAVDSVLHIVVRDDGIGGADPASGSGLVGLKDRAEAIGGTLAVQSPRGAGTSVHVALPVNGPGR